MVKCKFRPPETNIVISGRQAKGAHKNDSGVVCRDWPQNGPRLSAFLSEWPMERTQTEDVNEPDKAEALVTYDPALWCRLLL